MGQFIERGSDSGRAAAPSGVFLCMVGSYICFLPTARTAWLGNVNSGERAWRLVSGIIIRAQKPHWEYVSHENRLVNHRNDRDDHLLSCRTAGRGGSLMDGQVLRRPLTFLLKPGRAGLDRQGGLTDLTAATLGSSVIGLVSHCHASQFHESDGMCMHLVCRRRRMHLLMSLYLSFVNVCSCHLHATPASISRIPVSRVPSGAMLCRTCWAGFHLNPTYRLIWNVGMVFV